VLLRHDADVAVPRLSRPALVVAGLVVVSVVIRTIVAQRFTVPWIAPDEMLYGLLGESLWSNGTLSIRGTVSPYYSLLTPALVGASLAGRDIAAGIEIAQFLQAAAMSSTAIPVYLWACRLAPPRWAVLAASLAIAGPALVYSGLLMTEALFYPASTWALFALSATLERPTATRQGLFLLAVTTAAAVRMQALVLLPAFALATALNAWARRDRRRFLATAPLSVGIGVAALGIAVLRSVAPNVLGSAELLGAYATLGESTGVSGSAATAVLWHIAGVVLVSLVVPAVATVLLAVHVLGGRPASTTTQAYASTVVAYVPLLVVQVGLFASSRIEHISERYLITALPLLVVGLAAWIGAGAPRGRVAVASVAGATVVLVAVTPVTRLVPERAMHDALSSAPLLRLEGHDGLARLSLLSLAVLAIVLVALIPSRMVPLAALFVLVGLLAGSIEASRTVERLSSWEQNAALGGADPRWLDTSNIGEVAILFTGERPSTTEARTVFWNRSVREVLSLENVEVGFPPTTRSVTIDERGFVRTRSGRAVVRELVAVPTTTKLDGEPVVELPVGSSEAPGLVVWRTAERPLRVASRALGLLPNGDFSGTVNVLVPGCTRGALEVTFIGKTGDPIRIVVNGMPAPTIDVPAGQAPTRRIEAPAYVDGSHTCSFLLETDGYVGTTRIAYVPD